MVTNNNKLEGGFVLILTLNLPLSFFANDNNIICTFVRNYLIPYNILVADISRYHQPIWPPYNQVVCILLSYFIFYNYFLYIHWIIFEIIMIFIVIYFELKIYNYVIINYNQ